MSINQLPVRVVVNARGRMARRSDLGAATAEYGVTILVGIAFALAVLTLFTQGTMNDTITGLLNGVLDRAAKMVK